MTSWLVDEKFFAFVTEPPFGEKGKVFDKERCRIFSVNPKRDVDAQNNNP